MKNTDKKTVKMPLRGKLRFTQPTLTKQSFREESNINTIMRRYEKTGIIENISTKLGQYGDFSEVGTYQEAVNKIMLAQNTFDQLPSKIRQRFNNSPVEFVEFTSDPDNIDELRDIGLAEPLSPEIAKPSLEEPVEPSEKKS